MFTDDLVQHLNGLINFTEFTPQFREDLLASSQTVSDYERVRRVFAAKKQPSMPLLNCLDFGAELKATASQNQQLTCHLVGPADQVLVCSRYTSKTGRSYTSSCDLFLYDLNHVLVKHTRLSNCLVRCIQTSANCIVLTTEYEQKINFSINKLVNLKSFELNVYSPTLGLVKSAKIEANTHADPSLFYPQACCVDSDKIYLMKNTTPYLNVFDLGLNLVAKFGQDFSKQFNYYLAPHNVSNIRVKQSKLYIQRANCDKSTTIIVIDLVTGANMRKFSVNFQFADFYVSVNELVFLVDNNRLVAYNIEEKSVSAEVCLRGIRDVVAKDCIVTYEEYDEVTSFCMTGLGYLVLLYSKPFLIGIY